MRGGFAWSLTLRSGALSEPPLQRTPRRSMAAKRSLRTPGRDQMRWNHHPDTARNDHQRRHHKDYCGLDATPFDMVVLNNLDRSASASRPISTNRSDERRQRSPFPIVQTRTVRVTEPIRVARAIRLNRLPEGPLDTHAGLFREPREGMACKHRGMRFSVRTRAGCSACATAPRI
jgi:hypothetical protein